MSDRAIASLLRARVLIAMAGESGRWSWWECEATTPTGQFLVASLFPRTTAWTGIACAVETATAAVEIHMPPTPHLNLFSLDGETEGRCARLFALWRKEAKPEDVCIWPLEEGTGDLVTLLARVQAGAAPTPMPPGDRNGPQALAVGTASGPHPFGDADPGSAPLAPLINGFAHSTPGRVVVPYLGWNR